MGAAPAREAVPGPLAWLPLTGGAWGRLWESLALYENGELVDPRTLPYLVAGRPPTLAELDAQTNGDTWTVLGLSLAAFVDEWFAFVHRRYLR